MSAVSPKRANSFVRRRNVKPPFKLNATLGRAYNVDMNDVLRTKLALGKLGHFEMPSYGMTEYPDEPLFQGIESFQERHGLQRDGVMKPDGETAAKLEVVLDRAENETRKMAPKAFGLTGDVGLGRTNSPLDVSTTSQALAWAGVPLHPDGGAVSEMSDKGLPNAIKRFQASKGLKVDGWLRPYGETERALNRDLQSKVKALQIADDTNAIPATDMAMPVQQRSQQKEKGSIQIPIPRGAYEIAMYFGLPILVAMDWWQSMAGAQKTKGKLAGGGSDDDGSELEKQCEVRYGIDTETCNGITRTRGAAAGARCHATAANRYDACLRGVPVEYLPPLDTWNQ